VGKDPFLCSRQEFPGALRSRRPFAYAPTQVSTTAQMERATQPPRRISPRQRWLETGVIALLLGWLYYSTLSRLVSQWLNDPNFSHGFFVPLFSLFVLWQNRAKIARTAVRPSWVGAFILVFGLVVLVVGVLGAELFLSRSSLLVVVAGIVVLFWGWDMFHAILFPWAFLVLMIPIPAILFNQVTLPLQLLASRLASWLLPFLGVPVLREGNVIQLPAMALEVAEACSGIRSLLSLVTLAIIYGYLLSDSIRMRVVLAVAAVPIAVAANSLRIVGTGLLVQYWDPDKAEGFFHAFSGWLIFVVSLAMLFLLHKLLERLWPQPSQQKE
jgi:exosortase